MAGAHMYLAVPALSQAWRSCGTAAARTIHPIPSHPVPSNPILSGHHPMAGARTHTSDPPAGKLIVKVHTHKRGWRLKMRWVTSRDYVWVSAPHHTTPHHTTPLNTTPHHTTPHHSTPHHTTPHHTTLHHTHARTHIYTHAHTTPHHTTPHHTTPHVSARCCQ